MPFAKPGPYTTRLSPQEEQDFNTWVSVYKVPWQDTPTADYDMRGYYKALREGRAKQSLDPNDRRMHFPDTFKTPYHATFSNQSIYATPDAPHWEGDRLMDNQGNLIYDDSKRGTIESPIPPPPIQKPAPITMP